MSAPKSAVDELTVEFVAERLALMEWTTRYRVPLAATP